MKLLQQLLLVTLLFGLVCGDYDCACNYEVENSVYPTPSSNEQPIGYMYEFDCKPRGGKNGQPNFISIQFEKNIGYIDASSNVQLQTCPGQPPVDDLIPTTKASTTVTTTMFTSTIPPSSTISTMIPTSKLIMSSTFFPTSTAGYPSTSRMIDSTTEPPLASMSSTKISITTKPFSTTMYSTKISTNFVASTSQTTTSQSVKWPTAANVTGTPYEYIGIGYNLLSADPDSRRQDPGILTDKRILQFTPDGNGVLEATYTETPSCSSARQTFLVYGSKAYQNELKYFVNSPGSRVEISSAAFTFSQEIEATKTFFDQADRVYLDIAATCVNGSAHYKTNETASVSQQFARDVCALNISNNENLFRFLDKWGTNMVVSSDLGSKTVTRYSASPSDVYKEVQHMDPNLIEHEGYFNGFSSSVSININKFPSSLAATKPFGTLHSTFSKSAPIFLDTVPITAALDWSHWKLVADLLTGDGTCPYTLMSEDALQRLSTQLDSALGQYPSWKDAQSGYFHSRNPLTDHPKVQVPITWPSGTYGLMQTTRGCPGGNAGWVTGYRKQDTEDDESHNYYTAGIENYLAGEFHSNNLMTGFCIKYRASSSQYDEDWPIGSYCLLKKGGCPSGLYEGYLYWDDEDIANGNSYGGTLPDGEYGSNTKIYYCCRNDGSPTTKMFLPTDRPFVLLRYASQCQEVHGMTVRDLFLRWDDEDTLGGSSNGGMHPLDEGGPKDHLLHFCYYEARTGPSIIG